MTLPEERRREILVRFYCTENGREPALEWLRSLDREDRRAVGYDLMRVPLGWPIGMPLMRSMKEGLWEIRSQLPSRRIARLMICFQENKLVVLHGFVKKTRSTPAEDLALAKRRMKEVTT
jgi:phage-related protein